MSMAKTLDQKTYREITQICNLVLSQNYFQYSDIQYIQTNGLVMGVLCPPFFQKYFYST